MRRLQGWRWRALNLLDIRGVVKRFPGVVALRGVNLRLDEGEVLAVLGENGAGKSTLMKILAGVQPADEGEFRLGGKRVRINSVNDALEHGIALIHQELNLATNLDVAANIFLGRERLKGGGCSMMPRCGTRRGGSWRWWG